MEALTSCSSLSPHLLPPNPSSSSLKFPHFLPKFLLPKPRLRYLSFATPKNSLQFNQPTQNPINFDPSFNPGFGDYGLRPIMGFAPQTQETAMRGAAADVMGMLFEERIVFLGSYIDDNVAESIMNQLLLLDARASTKDIRLLINSNGGSLSAAMAIYDVMQLVRSDVSTIAFGVCASSASIILCGGAKGKRLAMPNARIMLDQPQGGTFGLVLDVEIQAREIMQHKNNVIRIICEHTGRTFEQVEKDLDKDLYMSPIEAVEYGLIDEVIDRDKIIPVPSLPEKVLPRYRFEEIHKDPMKFMIPDVPDDEIY